MTSNITEFEWIQLKQEMDTEMPFESAQEKLIRKLKSNPLVPIGAVATGGILTYGIYQFYKGNSQVSQSMMRFRIASQGLTLAALLAGIALSGASFKV